MVERITPNGAPLINTNTVPMNETDDDTNTQTIKQGSVVENDVEFKDRDALGNNGMSRTDRVARDNNAPVENRGVAVNEQATDVSRVGEDGTRAEVPDPVEAKRKDFETNQEAQRKTFERDSKATLTKMDRDRDFAKEKFERDSKIAERRQKNQELAFEHGVLTHDQLVRRNGLMAPHQQSGALLPHEVLADGEETVLMAFPRTVMLTLSADDAKRWRDNEPTGEGLTPVTHGSRVVFYQGYEDVPVGLSDHPYLRDAGAYRVSDDGKPESVEDRQKRVQAAKVEREKNTKKDAKAV